MAKKGTPPGKRKVVYIKKGKNYFEIYLDLNGDRVYDVVRIYKSPSSWRKLKRSGTFSTSVKAMLSLPEKYRTKYISKKKTKKKKGKK